MLQEQGLLPGPQRGPRCNSAMNCGRRHQCCKFCWERALGQRTEGKGTQESCSATWLKSGFEGFVVVVVISRLFLVNHWLRVPPEVDSSQEGSGRLVGPGVSSLLLILSWILLVGGSLLLPCSLPGPPVVKITHSNTYYLALPGRWRFQSFS